MHVSVHMRICELGCAQATTVIVRALAETLEREFPELKPEMNWREYKHPTWDWFSRKGGKNGRYKSHNGFETLSYDS
ncbi:unnamed protein product [Peniophora sp. CBMAI 1063]|nr:unnamed protein product [Peniophora sp. CBMAI 1063]